MDFLPIGCFFCVAVFLVPQAASEGSVEWHLDITCYMFWDPILIFRIVSGYQWVLCCLRVCIEFDYYIPTSYILSVSVSLWVSYFVFLCLCLTLCLCLSPLSLSLSLFFSSSLFLFRQNRQTNTQFKHTYVQRHAKTSVKHTNQTLETGNMYCRKVYPQFDIQKKRNSSWQAQFYKLNLFFFF